MAIYRLKSRIFAKTSNIGRQYNKGKNLGKQVSQLTKSNQDLTKKNVDLTNTNKTLTNKNIGLTNQVNDLTAKNTTLTDQISSLKNSNEELQGKAKSNLMRGATIGSVGTIAGIYGLNALEKRRKDSSFESENFVED